MYMHNIYEIIHICTAVVDESEVWSSQYIFQFKKLERRSLKKNQSFNGIQTHDLCDTDAMLYQLSHRSRIKTFVTFENSSTTNPQITFRIAWLF